VTSSLPLPGEGTQLGVQTVHGRRTGPSRPSRSERIGDDVWARDAGRVHAHPLQHFMPFLRNRSTTKRLDREEHTTASSTQLLHALPSHTLHPSSVDREEHTTACEVPNPALHQPLESRSNGNGPPTSRDASPLQKPLATLRREDARDRMDKMDTWTWLSG